jgi:oxygen-independent coproporphyrinogen-3 oxidase
MFWLPGQSMESWLGTVDQAIALAPEHLSLYLLELYPNAPLKETMARSAGPAPPAARQPWTQAPDDEAADMYLGALEQLDEAGYEQYEISNVARPGFPSRHNVKYWQGGAWRGFGCGAHSTIDDARWSNLAPTAEYIDAVGAGRSVAVGAHQRTEQARLEEALFTGLRLSEGVDCGNILRRYGVEPWIRWGATLQPFVDEGLMWRTPERFGLTRRGMLVANEILMGFV